MLKLNAIKSEKIWGYELWIASTHPNGLQQDFIKSVGSEYPLLVKIIQANDTLSVQVHPNDAFAVKLEGKGNVGKTECWYVLDAEPDSKIVYGIKETSTKQELKKAIEENKLEPHLNFVKVKKGDFIFIPAGTVHAIGPGLRLLEVQQSCDLTYRLYDWGRGREVHVEKSLQVIEQEKKSAIAPMKQEFECEYFRLELKDVRGGWSMLCSKGQNLSKDWQLIYVISSDKACIKSGSDKFAQTIFAEEIYAIAPGEKITIEGKAQILKVVAK